MKTITIKDLPVKFKPFIRKVRSYIILIFVVVVALMYGFLVYRVRLLANQEPTSDAVAQKLQTVQRPKIDQHAIDKMLQLQDNSTEVRALFQAARNNPFQE